MRRLILIGATLILLAGCDSPKDIVLGPEPLKQIADQGDKFKRLSEEDRKLLVAYLAAQSMGNLFSKGPIPTTGKTVGEVLKEAAEWKKTVLAAEAEQKKRDAEAAALKEKVKAEAAKIDAQLANMVTIAVIDKRVLPENYEVRRFSPLLMIKYALDNKGDKEIKQIKGRVYFTDPTGDPVGDLGVEMDTKLPPTKQMQTDTGIGWRVNNFSRGDIEKIAERDFNSMKGRFVISSIAFSDGTVIKKPE